MANLVSTTFTGDVSLNGNATLRANGQVDATAYTGNGAGLSGIAAFEANTSMIFNQASAPTGWTKQTGAALANTAMSIVTGTGGGTGGADSFYSTFTTGRATAPGSLPRPALTVPSLNVPPLNVPGVNIPALNVPPLNMPSRPVSGTVGNRALSTPQIAIHAHDGRRINTSPNERAAGTPLAPNRANPGRFNVPTAQHENNRGAGFTHNHPWSGTSAAGETGSSETGTGTTGSTETGTGVTGTGNIPAGNTGSGSFSIPAMNIKYANVIVANKD